VSTWFWGFSCLQEWMDYADSFQKNCRRCTECNRQKTISQFATDSDTCKSCERHPHLLGALPKLRICKTCRVELPNRFFGGRRHDQYPACMKNTTCVFCEAKTEDTRWTEKRDERNQFEAEEMRRKEELWWEQNADKVAQWAHEYSLDGMVERLSEEGRQREAAQIRATPPWADPKKIAAIYAEAARLTAETGIPHHVDHIVPLQGPVATYGPFKGMRIVFGLHWEGNLQVIPARDNVCKGNRWWPDMPEEVRATRKILRIAA